MLDDFYADDIPVDPEPERHSWYCNDCGMTATGSKTPFYMHECSPEFLILHQKEQFESQLATFLGSAEGKFAQYLAEQDREAA